MALLLGRAGSGFSQPGASLLPAQGGQSGRFLTTNGTTASWAAVGPLNRVATDTTVGNTAVETTIYSFSVAGGTLSTTVRLRLVLQGRISWNGVDANAFTLRLKYGATTLVAIGNNGTGSSSPANAGCHIEALLSGDTATNAQVGIIKTNLHLTLSGAYPNDVMAVGQGTAAEDSTAARILAVTFQWALALPAETYTMQHALLEQL